MAETAIVVLVPELEPILGPWRDAFTGDGARGMPPHVTLLYPFAADAEVGRLLPEVGRLLAAFAPFEVAFAEVRRWPDVLYLAPEPPEPFVAIVERLVETFPQYRPYGGAYEDIVPHLTIAHGGRERFDAIESALAPTLPVRVRVERVWLMREGSEGWRRQTPFPLDRR